MLRPLTILERRIFAFGAVTVLIVMLVTLASINRYRLWRAEIDIRLLQDRFAELQKTRADNREALRAELDDLERTVYTPMDAPPPPVRRPASIEQWMLNTTNDLRERVKKLEAWRYREESGR